MALTALEIKSVSCPKDKKQIKKFDSNGLFLLIKINGSKLWRLKYRFGGKYQEMALGKYPQITLSDARKSAENARTLLSQGINPMEERKKNKRQTPEETLFKNVSMKWWEQQENSWSSDHRERVRRWITIDAKILHELSIEKIDAGHITELMLAIEATGSPKKAPPFFQ